MSDTLPRPLIVGRWSLLGSPDRRTAGKPGTKRPGELYCPVGYLLHWAGESDIKMRGKSDVSNAQVKRLAKHYGINFIAIRRLMGLSQIESNEARATCACIAYEAMGINMEPLLEEEAV